MTRNTVSRVEFEDTTRARRKLIERLAEEERKARTPQLWSGRGRPSGGREVSLPEYLVSKLPTRDTRDSVRMLTHGIARTGNLILRTLDLPNRIFGNSRSLLQDIYEKSEANLERDAYENPNGGARIGETAVHLATSGVLGKALPAVFGANVGADTYETAKYAGASEGEALAKGVGHGVVDTAIWTLGQGLASKYLPKAWQWLGREIVGAGRGAASSVTSDAVLNSLGADISGEEMAKRAVHAAWMVPLLGMLKMGKGSRERALAELKKVRPDLAGERVDKVIETLENEFSDPRSQKVALAWVARKGANLPDDLAQIHQAIEVANKVKGVDFTQKSPFEIISDPAYARYLPKPKPQDVKAFSNMKRYPMGVIGFDVSDDAAGRQAVREMINAYMSPSSNPWCLATGSGAAKLGGLGPDAESYWKQHSAVPKQIFFQEVDGRLELTAFRATSPGGEGRQEYWDTSDAGYSGIPIKKKIPGDPLGRYERYIFKPAETEQARKDKDLARIQQSIDELEQDRWSLGGGTRNPTYEQDRLDLIAQRDAILARPMKPEPHGEVQGTFENIAPGKVFKGDPFRDGRSQTWVKNPNASLSESGLDAIYVSGLPMPPGTRTRSELERLSAGYDRMIRASDGQSERARQLTEYKAIVDTALSRVGKPVDDPYILVEDKLRTTENGLTKFRTTRYADPTDWDYGPPKPGETPKPVEIEESELVSPEWMRARGYDPESEADVRRMQRELDVRAWGNGQEAAMAVVPTKRTYLDTKTGYSETATYAPDGRTVTSVDFTRDGVPYREEFFENGPSEVWLNVPYQLKELNDPFTNAAFPVSNIRGYQIAGGDPEPQWTSRPDALQGQGFRVIRNPGGSDSTVLDELKWDEELGSFVRTSGNRRWRLVEREAPTYNLRDPVQAERALAAHDEWLENEGSVPPRVVVEDRQPDGTWAPAVDRGVNAETGEVVELPPPPPAVRTSDTRRNDLPFALKAGRTRRNVRAAEGGGDTPGSPGASVPKGPAPASAGGPRIVINPRVFEDKRDALCVAFNEAFRVVMEDNGFEPVSEPTDKQRKFFADTAYAGDELQLRRTILARIATLDTSVSDPTDEQLEETAEMLEMVMEVGAPQNEWEQRAVQRLHDVVAGIRQS